MSQLEDCREAISDFESTNTGLLNLRINNVMKTLASLSFVAFPAILLAEISAMNTQDTPVIGWPHAFWIVVGVMAIMVVTTYIYFKKKDWLSSTGAKYGRNQLKGREVFGVFFRHNRRNGFGLYL